MKPLLRCDNSDDRHLLVISCGTVYYAVEVSSKFWVGGCNPVMWQNETSLPVLFALYYLFLSILQQGIITLITSGRKKDTLILM